MSFAEGYSEQISETLIKTGNLKDAKEAMGDFSGYLNEIAQSTSESEIFTREGLNQWQTEQERLNREIDRYQTRLTDLSRATGRTEDEILSLAQSMEIDLSDPMLNLQEVMAETGLAVGRFGDEFNATINSAFGQAIADAVITPLQILENEPAINAATQSVREAVLGGTFGTQEGLQFLQAAATQANLVGMGDPLRALEYLVANLGVGGAQFQTGAALGGLRGSIMGGETGAAFEQLISQTRGPIEQQILENIISDAAAGGFTVNTGQVAQQLAAMSLDQLLVAATGARTAGFLSAQMGTDYLGRSDEELLRAGLSQLGIQADTDKLISENQQFLDDLEDAILTPMDKFTAAVEEMKTAIIDALGSQGSSSGGFREGQARDSTVTNQQVNPDGPGGPMDRHRGRKGDTRSPRRSLVDTMMAHRRFNAMVAGSRSVTSSLRGYNLGSMGSDHAAGRAYDLVGQNLGLYASMVNNSGGLAQFHGAGGSRHLHVVPGSTPMGDTATPYMGGGMMTPAVQGGSTNINVQVYGTPGMDEEALANAVVRKIESQQRSMAERR